MWISQTCLWYYRQGCLLVLLFLAERFTASDWRQRLQKSKIIL